MSLDFSVLPHPLQQCRTRKLVPETPTLSLFNTGVPGGTHNDTHLQDPYKYYSELFSFLSECCDQAGVLDGVKGMNECSPTRRSSVSSKSSNGSN